jgi:hypothetical protein
MDCRDIERDEIIDRYLAGTLSDTERNLFEEHCFTCDSCFEALRETEQVALGLERLDREGALTFETPETFASRLLMWFRWRPSPALATAMIIMIIALIYPAYRGVVTVSRQGAAPKSLSEPRANVPSFNLKQTVRGESQIIHVPGGEDASFVLYFTVPDKALADPQYWAEITGPDGTVIWTVEDLEGTGEYEVFSLLCPAAFFERGRHILNVYEVDRGDKEIHNRFSFAFDLIGQ